jgi:hypothetical protein
LANTKVDTKKYELQSEEQQVSWFKSCRSVPAVNKRIDWFKINKNNTATAEPVPIVNQLMLGQVNASLPIFAGFKIQNSIKAYDVSGRSSQRHAN